MTECRDAEPARARLHREPHHAEDDAVCQAAYQQNCARKVRHLEGSAAASYAWQQRGLNGRQIAILQLVQPG